MKTNFWWLFLLTLILNQAKGQEYTKIVKPNLTTWYFAHQQLEDKFIDTIFAGGQIDGWIDLWYHGVFMNHEKTYMGKIKCSPNNDSIWYIAPEETKEWLIFDLTLNRGDTFNFLGLAVDTVFYKDNKKYVEFDRDTHWDENIQFVEGVGPNLSFVYAWANPGILHPFVICQFEEGQKIYSTDNSHFKDCDFLTSNIPLDNPREIRVFPVPFKEELKIHFQSPRHGPVCIFDLLGKMVYQDDYQGTEATINTSGFNRGLYFLKFSIKSQYITYKIVKQ